MKSAKRAEVSSVRSDLGQRAKASRAAAKRVSTAALSAVEKSDPILPHIAEAYRLMRICDEAFAAHDQQGLGGTFEQADDAQDALVAHCDNVLMQIRPTSAAGAVALARFAVDWFESQGVPLARDEYGTSVLRLIAAPFSPAEHPYASRRELSTAAAAPQGSTEAPRATVSRLPHATRLDDVLDNARSYANEFDFSPFSIKDLAHLFDVARHAGTYWGDVGNMPLSGGFGADGSSLTNVGWFVEGEEQRMSFLRDRCVAEIAQRGPTNDSERDEILCVRIAHEFDCNGRIDRAEAPSLLIEALKAWG
ncbi:hypothetical protein [Methylobacterium flocculans]|uniref:hypothetical protein n=1 Tax=Methylobacterium flocculans TaxID=2984843 RepID=UPI0021F3A4BE|nr:hypothetical protein [Methylobacterium sp. FF17]